jgi:hypothetical protein
MKFALLVLFMFSSAAFAFEKVKINGQLYVAEGFDDNDLVEVTVVGTLPNTCYRNPSYDIEMKDNKYSIRLYANYIPSEEGCREVTMAYTETINFGMMYAGKYGIALVNKANTELKKLEVKVASSQLVDEFLYGNVSGLVENESSREIELVGANPVNCLVFDKMLSEVQNTTIVLRPQFKEVGVCSNKSKPFKIKYTVPYLSNQPKGIMIHVRVMNGRSFNYLYQNKL